MKIYKKLAEIQQKIKVGKSRWNKFGEFYYRSAEDILVELLPMLGEYTIIIEEEIVEYTQGVYIKSIAKMSDGVETIIATAYAREDKERPKMSGAQLTGTASSYAKKYALGNLLGLSDAADADALPAQKETKKVESVQSKVKIDGGQARKIAEAIRRYPDDTFLHSLGESLKKYGSLTGKQLSALNIKLDQPYHDTSEADALTDDFERHMGGAE